MKMQKKYIVLWVSALLASSILTGCGKNHGSKPEFEAKNNTAEITYTMKYSAEQMKNELCNTLWNCQYFDNQPARNFCFYEDGSLLVNLLGIHPTSLYPAGNKNKVYEYDGRWYYDEASHVITLSYNEYDDSYVMYEYDGEICMISSSWDPANEGKYAFLADEDENYFYDNTPSESSMLKKASANDVLLFNKPQEAGIRNELVGIWATNPENIGFSHVLLLKSDGTLYFSVNIGGSSVTHKGLWAEKDGKLYLTYFDEYSSSDYNSMMQARCWFVFDYTFENGILRSEDVFFDNDYHYYGDESQAAL